MTTLPSRSSLQQQRQQQRRRRRRLVPVNNKNAFLLLFAVLLLIVIKPQESQCFCPYRSLWREKGPCRRRQQSSSSGAAAASAAAFVDQYSLPLLLLSSSSSSSSSSRVVIRSSSSLYGEKSDNNNNDRDTASDNNNNDSDSKEEQQLSDDRLLEIIRERAFSTTATAEAAVVRKTTTKATTNNSNSNSNKPSHFIFIVSDSSGVTAKNAVQRSLVQFNGCDERFVNYPVLQMTANHSNVDDVDDDDADEDDEYEESCELIGTNIVPFVKTEEEISAVVKRAAAVRAMVVYTLTDPDLRDKTARMCELSGLQHVDFLGSLFDAMSTYLDRPIRNVFQLEQERYASTSTTLASSSSSSSSSAAISNTGRLRRRRRRQLSDAYYRRIEAVEFTLKCDDGKRPELLDQADVVLCGVSRTGKTPLSVVLAQTQGLKVANVPLVVDLPPPAQLMDGTAVDPQRVFCLTLNIDDLQYIRSHRLRLQLTGTGRKDNGNDKGAAAAASPSGSGGGSGGGSGSGKRTGGFVRRQRQRRSGGSAAPSTVTTTTPRARNTYADYEYISKDLRHAREVARRGQFTEIDVTGRAVEETASLIASILNDRFPASTFSAEQDILTM